MAQAPLENRESPPKTTPLYATHQRIKARFVPFGGFLMPVQYTSIIEEHLAVRQSAGLFDVSHMGEVIVTGEQAEEFLQYVTTNDIKKIEDGQAQYTLLLYPDGGVVDDIVIYKVSPQYYFICVNASNTWKDFEWLLHESQKFKVTVENKSDDYAQIALQGPRSEEILQKLVDIDLKKVKYYRFVTQNVMGFSCLVARTGYTGEDGFEVFMPPKLAPQLWKKIFAVGGSQVRPCGLGARDTLRIEMKYPLYGHEISEKIHPFEASLGWVVKMDKGDFIGREKLAEKQKNVQRKLVGFELKDPGVARQGYAILNVATDKRIGEVTSGTMSPVLKKAIGIGFVSPEFSSVGTEVAIDIRGRGALAQIVPTPFVKKKGV